MTVRRPGSVNRGRPAALATVLALAACGGGAAGGGAVDATTDGASPFNEDVAPVADAAPPPVDAAPTAPAPDASAPPPARCSVDADCEPAAYCVVETGACTAGCRVEPDNCRNTSGGLPQRCSPEARTCEVAEAPPQGCAADTDCPGGFWCGADGHCEAGCRAGAAEECAAGTSCQDHRCVAPPCVVDDDCGPGTYCAGAEEAGVCAPGCRGPGDCEPGQHCDATHLCRVACVDDVDCAAPEYCDVDLGSCRVPCVVAGHRGCLPDERCDAETLRCVAGCRDDAGEAGAGNDTPERAQNVPLAVDANQPGVVSGAAAGRVLCPGDADYLALNLPAPGRMEVALTFDSAPGDLTLTLADAAGNTVARSSGPSPLVVRWPGLGEAPQGTAFVAGVTAAALSAPTGYTLAVRTAPAATGCFPDAHDPLDDEAVTGRSVGQRPEPRSVERLSGNLCDGDVDWVCFAMEVNDGLMATVEAGPDCAPLALALRPAREPEGVPTAEGSVTAAPDGGAIHRIEVVPEGGVFRNERYCLSLATTEAGGQCEDWALTLELLRSAVRCADSAEPNEVLGDARPLDGNGPLAGPDGLLPPGQALPWPDDLRLCPEDEDVFRLNTGGGDVIQAWIEGGPELGAAEVALLDASGRARGDLGGVSPPGAAARVAALAVAEAGGTWYVRVRADQVGGGAYQLFVRRDPPGIGCATDLHEPAAGNEGPETAQVLASPRPGRYTVTNGQLCAAQPGIPDEDWYAFSVPASGRRMCMTATFLQRLGNLDLELYRGDLLDGVACAEEDPCEAGLCVAGHCQLPRGVSRTQHDGEMLAFSAAEGEPGEYLLRVFSDDLAGNAYDLGVTVEGPRADCVPDYEESDRPNDTPESATPLGAGRAQVCDAWICRDERQTGDWYRVRVPAGEDRTVHVGFDGLTDGMVTLTLLDPDHPQAGEVFVAEANTLAQCLNVRGGPVAADLLIGVAAARVLDDGDARVDYTLQVAPTDLGRDDRGACDALSGGLYEHIPWPTYTMGF